MITSDEDPIVAVATAAGKGGVGIIRLSFQKKMDNEIIEKLFPQTTLRPRFAHLKKIQNKNEELLDEAIVLYFPAPSSYTGESVIEIQAHGGPILLKMIVDEVLDSCKKYGMRLAEPGEFTKRAFLNGRIDLAQAEAVSDLIDAASRSAAVAATRSLTGEFSEKTRNIGTSIDEARAFTEAVLDFPEEEIDPIQEEALKNKVEQARNQLEQLIASAEQGRILREGVTVALVGSPNVGKSSLMNALAGEEVAIVTEIAGTTRDKIEHWVTISGVPIKLVDTAGLRQTNDIVETKGIERTKEELKKADIVLHLIDGSLKIDDDLDVLNTVKNQVRGDVPVLNVANKMDLGAGDKQEYDLVISAKTGEGLNELKEKLLMLVGVRSNTEGLFIARERHIRCMNEATEHLNTALELWNGPLALELLAEELRLASLSLGGVLGQTTADDILGLIFSKFCIGK